MSIVYSADVICDGCAQWTPGPTGRAKPPGKLEAFEEADTKGWLKVSYSSHLCPDCLAAARQQQEGGGDG